MSDERLTGVLLVQLGTPDSSHPRDVRRYLAEFLSDPRVLDLPAVPRWMLLHTVILRFRPRRSAEAYSKIWTEAGSPLILHTRALAEALAAALGSGYRVAVGMRYRRPSLEDAITSLIEDGVSRLVVLPLFPQYSSAATGSAVERTLEILGRRTSIPALTVLGGFFDHRGWIESVAEVAEGVLDGFAPDHVLFSYHGLPESQIERGDPTGDWCLRDQGCCDRLSARNRFCYRAQCFATTAALASVLGLSRYSTSFQSRLAGRPWIKPFTDQELPRLYGSGVRRLAVLTPSFVADCLETLEEIGIRGRDQWMGLGGEDFCLVPCVNSSPRWVNAVADLVIGTSSAGG